jgi:hypothetical protein
LPLATAIAVMFSLALGGFALQCSADGWTGGGGYASSATVSASRLKPGQTITVHVIAAPGTSWRFRASAGTPRSP